MSPPLIPPRHRHLLSRHLGLIPGPPDFALAAAIPPTRPAYSLRLLVSPLLLIAVGHLRAPARRPAPAPSPILSLSSPIPSACGDSLAGARTSPYASPLVLGSSGGFAPNSSTHYRHLVHSRPDWPRPVARLSDCRPRLASYLHSFLFETGFDFSTRQGVNLISIL